MFTKEDAKILRRDVANNIDKAINNKIAKCTLMLDYLLIAFVCIAMIIIMITFCY